MTENQFLRLPLEILRYLFSFVSLESSLNLPKICKLFHHEITEEFWREKCLNWWKSKGLDDHYPLEPLVTKAQSLSQYGWVFFAVCFSHQSSVGSSGLSFRIKEEGYIIGIGFFKNQVPTCWGIMLYPKGTDTCWIFLRYF